MKPSNFYFLLLAFSICSCFEKKSSKTAEDKLPLIQTKEILKSSRNCIPDSITCAYMKIAYPEFTDSIKNKINDLIYHKVESIVSSYLGEESETKSLPLCAQLFVDDYESFKADYPEYKFGWYLNLKSEIIYDTDEVVSFSIYYSVFTGGAHPNSSTSYFIIDTATLRELSLSDIIGDTLKLKKLLEQEFRNVKGIKENQSLADAGYYLNDGDFSLSNNIGITDESIIVHFNPYEIAPYSLGATTLELNRKTMGSILKLK